MIKTAADVKIESSWKQRLESEFEKPYFHELIDFVKSEYQTQTIFPPGPQIFHAFDLCPFEQTEVVIIGQDPYHGPRQANGLCFSVSEGISKPPSLKNIFLEIKDDVGTEIPKSGNLERWASQGVLLLNATLTVRQNQPGSHQGKGWEQFTDEAIRKVATEKEKLVFILWGAYAHKKGAIIPEGKHLILKAAHPSPFAAHKGFFGCKHFSKANEYLVENGKKPIVW